MSRPAITPVHRETPLGLEELFISTTDRKGIIRMSNAVFVRVSGWTEDELFGQAHNIVRHPDMPRAVFRVFWEYLEAGRPIAAYVKNLSRDGSYYWVMAIAIPYEEGFLSVRLKPTSPLLATAQEIYRDVLAREAEVEGGDVRNRKAAVAAGHERLLERLADAGYGSYDAFMRAALPAEVAAREATLAAAPAEATADPIGAACARTQALLAGMSANLGAYSELSGTLGRKSAFVEQLADDVRLFSLNALLAASQLTEGAALEAVADLMRSRSDAATPVIRELSGEIVATVELLSEMGFRMAAAKLQSEMMAAFLAEHTDDRAALDAQLRLLAAAVGDAIEELCVSLATLDEHLRAVVARTAALRRELQVIRALEVNGRVEAARASDADAVQVLFQTIGKQVADAQDEIAEFDQVEVVIRSRDAANERDARESAVRLREVVAA
jgi:aerotaxis receptor